MKIALDQHAVGQIVDIMISDSVFSMHLAQRINSQQEGGWLSQGTPT